MAHDAAGRPHVEQPSFTSCPAVAVFVSPGDLDRREPGWRRNALRVSHCFILAGFVYGDATRWVGLLRPGWSRSRRDRAGSKHADAISAVSAGLFVVYPARPDPSARDLPQYRRDDSADVCRALALDRP